MVLLLRTDLPKLYFFNHLDFLWYLCRLEERSKKNVNSNLMHEKTNSHELFLCMDYGNTMVRRTNPSCWIGGGVNCPREKTTFAENIQTNLLYLDVAASLPVRDSVLLRSPCFSPNYALLPNWLSLRRSYLDAHIYLMIF